MLLTKGEKQKHRITVNTNLTACVMAPLVHKDITLLSRTVRHQCLYPLHWKLAAVHSLFLNLKNKKNKHKKQQCIDKHLWLNPIRYLYINSVYPAGSFVPGTGFRYALQRTRVRLCTFTGSI